MWKCRVMTASRWAWVGQSSNRWSYMHSRVFGVSDLSLREFFLSPFWNKSSVETCPLQHSPSPRQMYLGLPAGSHSNNSRTSPAKHKQKWMQESVAYFFTRTRPFTHLSSCRIETMFRNKMFSKNSMFNFHFLSPIEVVNILEVRIQKCSSTAYSEASDLVQCFMRLSHNSFQLPQ